MNPIRAGNLAYCTNVHAGVELEEIFENLERHALAVKRQVRPDSEMGIGLWLAAPVARRLAEGGAAGRLADWLAERRLLPCTVNGFPYGDFHSERVKHKVYSPNWCDVARRDYTHDLIDVLHQLLPPGQEGSISTLPIAWPEAQLVDDHWRLAAGHLLSIAEYLERLEDRTGRLIYVCLEPEPGCLLQRVEDVVRFFKRFLLVGPHSGRRARYLRVCHDVCHSAVMFESQADVLETYRREGIAVGKVQISSAIRARFPGAENVNRANAMLEQLSAFAEDRYLHQTMIRCGVPSTPRFFEDLPIALDWAKANPVADTEWRIHFHVPIYLERFAALETTRSAIDECLKHFGRGSVELPHFEVETYAWTVLPRELQLSSLADGISRELQWLDQHPGFGPDHDQRP